MQDITRAQQKVHLISLGCARNRVDSEVMLGSMLKLGWEVADAPEQADAIVVNTCGFIGPAKQESVDTILAAAEHKRENPQLKLIVTGCLTQRYKTQLAKGLPEVDFFVGTDEFPRLGQLIQSSQPKGAVFAKRTHYLYDEEIARVNTLNPHAAYVKVAEGCQHNCAFCIIPAIRGKLRSRSVESVVREVTQLTKSGVVEVNLIAQDLAAFGRDRGANLLELLTGLEDISGLQWIRCLYMYPENIDESFLDHFNNSVKLVKYLDVPVQHASDAVLKRMNRCVTRDQLRTTLARLRRRVDGIAIRTSVMVGFPGETDADFAQLLAFIEEQEFDHLGCFKYSQEEGTVAGRMPGQVPEEVKGQRYAAIMQAQKKISRTNLKRHIGTIQQVLVDGPSHETPLLWQGRLATQAPEVDGLVFINDGEPVAGKIQMVRITETHEYDVVGEVLGKTLH